MYYYFVSYTFSDPSARGNGFGNMGVKTNKTRLFEQTLENFYEKNNLKVANPKRITLQKYMTREQAVELSDIVMSFAEEPQGLVFEEYKQKFDSIDKVIADARIIGGEENFNVDRFLSFQDQFGVRNYQDFIDVIDALNNRKIDALLKEIEESNGQVGFAFSELIDVTKVKKEKGKK